MTLSKSKRQLRVFDIVSEDLNLRQIVGMTSNPETAQHPILRVFQSKNQTRAFYNTISRVHDLLSERSEAPMRKTGLDLLNAQPGESILEIGFGTGHTLVALARSVEAKGTVYGLDLSDQMAKFAKENVTKVKFSARVKIRCGDAAHLPHPDNSMDESYAS